MTWRSGDALARTIASVLCLFVLWLDPVLTGSEARAETAPPVLDLNEADETALETLPGIGPARARAITAYRTQHGPFQRPDDIQRVSGVGPSTFARICARIRVGDQPGCTRESPPAQESGLPARASINVNLASVEELMTLPQIGERRAQSIVAYREQVGPFEAPDDLLVISGIGPATMEQLRPYVRTHVDLNRATLEDLSRIPGVDPSLAERVLRDREERGPFTAVESLVRVSGILPGDLAHWRRYVVVDTP